MDSFEQVMADLDDVFRYDESERPQDRAHGYLDARDIGRTATDTAMQCAARDMVRRSYLAGRMDEARDGGDHARRLRAMARELLDIADGGEGQANDSKPF